MKNHTPYIHTHTYITDPLREKKLNFGEQSEGDFNAFMQRLEKAKADYIAE